MKRIISKIIKLNILGILFMFSFSLTVKAAGTAIVSITGNTSNPINKNITLRLTTSSVNGTNGGIVSFGGNLSFDSSALEYVSSSGATTPYTFQINTAANYKIAGLDTTLSNGITSTGSTTVFTFIFKPLKQGSTTVSFTNGKLTDTIGNIETTYQSKSINITAPQNTDNTLASLSVNGYTITPAFNKNTTTYSLTVPTEVTSLTIDATATASTSTVSGTGNKTLSIGANPLTVNVTSESGSTKTYTLNVTREAAPVVTLDSDTSLASLTVAGYTLSPVFNKDVLSYEVIVPASAESIIINASPTSNKSTVSGVGNKSLASASSFDVVVTSESGNTRTYTLLVTKSVIPEIKKNADATLKSLKMESYQLSPVFDKKTNTYSVTVENDVTGANVEALANNPLATVTVNGNYNWKAGVNVVTILVEAEDGTTNMYIINVTKKALTPTSENKPKSNDNYLKSLIVTNGELSQNFDPKVSNYSITIPYEDNKLDIKYAPNNSNSVAIITGNSNFKVLDNNVVTIAIVAEDGSVRYYTLNVTRSSQESKNKLSSLTIPNATMSPKFKSDVYEYEIDVDSDVEKIDINAIPANKNSTVEIIGNNKLNPGLNNVLVKVTDENDLVQYYALSVNRQADDSISLFGLNKTSSILIASTLGILTLVFALALVVALFKSRAGYQPPVIEIKPEFNFNSKNVATDTPSMLAGLPGTEEPVNQIASPSVETPQLENKPVETSSINKGKTINYIEAEYKEKEIPYDPYDDIVTKSEIIDAIEEKNTEKLEMLFEQEMLNRKKMRLREAEEGEKKENEKSFKKEHQQYFKNDYKKGNKKPYKKYNKKRNQK